MVMAGLEAASAARALYRRCLRVQRRWPAEADRPGRNVKDALRIQARSRFRAVRGRTQTDGDVATQLTEGATQVAALEAVLANQFARQHPRAADALDPITLANARKRNSLLSTESQQVLKARMPFWTRFLGLLRPAAPK